MRSRAASQRRPSLPRTLARLGPLALVLLAAQSGAAEQPAVEAPGHRPRVEAHQIWVLELRLGPRILSPGVLAIENEGTLLLPLAELAEAFELAIEVDPERATAGGWLIHPRRAFELDLATNLLTVEERPHDLRPSRIIVWSQDIYVDPRSLSRWWPVDLSVDARRMRIDALPRETLPVEKRFARERLHRRLGRRALPEGRSGHASDYRIWGLPAIDLNLESRRVVSNDVTNYRSEFDVATTGDLLWLQTESLLTGVVDESAELRMRAGRRDVDGRLGGPLQLRSFTLGDVATPSISHLSQARSGRGIQISSFPLDRASELGRVTLEGDLRPGWEVELFRDGLLLDFRDDSDERRYRFEDVPTVPGLNQFRLVFHGPRGERREATRRIWADGGLAPAGRPRFRLTLNQQEEEVWSTGLDEDRIPLHGETRAIGELEYGFHEDFTLALGAASLPLIEGRREFANAGARGQIAGSLLRADGFASRDGGWAAGGGWQTRLSKVSLSLSHYEFRDFLSERTRLEGGQRLRARSEATLDGPLPLARALRYRLGLGQSRRLDGQLDSDAQLRLSGWLKPAWITHVLFAQIDRGDGFASEQIDGELLATSRFGPIGLRGRFRYSALPADLGALSGSADWSPGSAFHTRIGAAHTFSGSSLFFANLSRRWGPLIWSAQAQVDERGVVQGGIGISFGLAPDPLRGGLQLQPPTATRSGSVATRVFLDHDANGRFDATDEALPGVGFRVPGARNLRSARDGSLMLSGLPVEQRVDVAIDPTTLSDPHWLAPEAGDPVVLRAGAPMRLDFPVVPIGEIDGFVRRWSPQGSKAIPGIAVELLDREGAVVARTRSEIDGFYLFPEVIPGRYSLRVDPKQAQRLGLVNGPRRQVILRGVGALLSNYNLLLHERRESSKHSSPKRAARW